jgi:hypothetical protein
VRLCCTANASGAGDVDEKVIGLVKKNGISFLLLTADFENFVELFVWIMGYGARGGSQIEFGVVGVGLRARKTLHMG